MKTSGNTILITGGSTGIGFALADAFLKEGNRVIVCARSEENLRIAKNRLPDLVTRSSDLSREVDRESLHEWVRSNFGDINILINNAGIQRTIDFKNGLADLMKYRAMDGEDEIEINFSAYVYMAAYFIPELLRKSEAAVVNVSSGLGFAPLAMMPVYCATKAAIHSFTNSLRHQLKATSVHVFEASPPTTDTDLDESLAGEEEQAYRGISPQEVAAKIIEGMKADKEQIIVGEAQGLYQAALRDPDAIFKQLND